MPEIDVAHGGASSGASTAKVLYAVDGRCPPGGTATDLAALTGAAAAAVAAGDGNILEVSHFTFPNGAITLVFILAESHLSVHTWPEEDLIAIDLFSCGAIDGQIVIDHLVSELSMHSVTVRKLDRGIPPDI